MELVWSNAKEFNKPGSSKSIAAEFLARTWRRKFASIRNDTMGTRLWRGKISRSKLKKVRRSCGGDVINGESANVLDRGNKILGLPQGSSKMVWSPKSSGSYEKKWGAISDRVLRPKLIMSTPEIYNKKRVELHY